MYLCKKKSIENKNIKWKKTFMRYIEQWKSVNLHDYGMQRYGSINISNEDLKKMFGKPLACSYVERYGSKPYIYIYYIFIDRVGELIILNKFNIPEKSVYALYSTDLSCISSWKKWVRDIYGYHLRFLPM